MPPALLPLLLGAATAAPMAEVVTIDAPIAVDGALDEPAWQEAQPVEDFLRFQPTDGGPPPGATEVRFLQDDRALYVGIRVRDVDYRVRARISPREDVNADDQVGVYLDTFHDGRTGYIFYLNPLGVQQDIRHNNGSWNASWDTAFTSRGRVTEDGYEIEIAFPWRSLKYPSGEGAQTWGLILTRKVPHEGAKYGFPVVQRNHPQLFAQAAELRGVSPPRRGSGLELIPSITAAQQYDEAATPPGWSGFDPWFEAVRPSLDLRFGITPDIGVAATLNPDFSQVESDVSDVRLNPRFAFRFPEQRPFFLDGIEFYQDRPDTLYTRSINDPLWGVKISGREGPVSLGVVHALDRDPLPSFHEDGAEGFDDDDVQDRWAENTMGRVQLQAFGSGYVGLSLADKRLLGTSAAPGPSGSWDGLGLDARVPLGRRWTLGMSSLQTYTASAEGPDLGWGMGNEVALTRASGVGAGFSLALSDSTPGYRKETGFLTQSGLTTGATTLDYTFATPGAVDTYTPSLTATFVEERDGDHYRDVGSRQAILVRGVHDLWVGGGLGERSEQGVSVDGWWVEGGYAGQVGAWLEASPTASVSRGLDFDLLVPAETLTTALNATLRPTVGIRLDATGSLARHAPEGAEVQLAQLLRGRLNWQFTRALGLRLVSEHTDGTALDPTLRSSALLTWLEVPGTAAYLGYAQTDLLLDTIDTVEREVFLKLSVLLRP